VLAVSERRVCRVLGQHRSTQRKVPRGADDEAALTEDIIAQEASRECLALPVARRLRSEDVLAALAELFVRRGPPAHIRSDNGSEFIAKAVQEWLGRIGVKTL
jgi:transposase InsO family protein